MGDRGVLFFVGGVGGGGGGGKVDGIHPFIVRLPGLRKAGTVKVDQKMSK